MFTKRKGIAPIAIVILIALGLIGGASAGYGFRENIKKMVSGQNTAEEISQAISQEIAKLGQNKFELEGTATSVDVSSKIIIVKIKSSTNSIKEFRLSETPIAIIETTKISFGDQKDLKIADIPINAQVHVGGTISEGILTATKVIIQKEDVAEEQGEVQKQKDFKVEGVVKSIAADSLTVTIASASKRANSQKGKDLEIKVISTTIIEKDEVAITIADIKENDEVKIEGIIADDAYAASKIEVKVEEEGEDLEATPTPTASSASQGQDSNQSENSNRGNSQNEDKENE